MKGHEPLIELRRKGLAVQSVWFAFDGESWRYWPASLGVAWRQFPESTGTADVLIEPADVIHRLDLRFAVGLRCWVHGPDGERVRELHEALAKAKAKRVLSWSTKTDARGNTKAVDFLDTAGLMVGA